MMKVESENREKETSVRIEWLDILKGILIVFVILSHSYPPQIYRNFFTPFFLTMFFWVSGYAFSAKKDFVTFIKNKGKRLLVPFLILGGARVVLAFVLEGGKLLERITGFFLQISCRYDELWFVACMCSCSLLFYGLVRLSEKYQGKQQELVLLLGAGVFLTLGMLDMCVWQVRLPWQLEIAGMMVFYMALGYLYRKHEVAIEQNKWSRVGIGIAGVGYGVLAIVIPNNVDIHMEHFEYPFFFLIMTVIVILPIVYLSKNWMKYSWSKVLTFFGRYTLFYYAFGGSVRIVLEKICQMLGGANEYIFPLVCTVCTMVGLAFPAWLVGKYFPWALGRNRKRK